MPFYSSFLLAFNEHFHLGSNMEVQIDHLEAFQMFGNMIVLSLFRESGFRWEDPITLRFCLQILYY